MSTSRFVSRFFFNASFTADIWQSHSFITWGISNTIIRMSHTFHLLETPILQPFVRDVVSKAASIEGSYASFTCACVSFSFSRTPVNGFVYVWLFSSYIHSLCWGSRIDQIFLHSMQRVASVPMCRVVRLCTESKFVRTLRHHSFVHLLRERTNEMQSIITSPFRTLQQPGTF